MNFLAHAYLSGNQTEILIGNMISDFVKGSKKFDYSPGIQAGIMHHRAIDTFTDQHPVTREAKKIFKQAYGLYAGAFMDVVYDHYLANDKNEFKAEQLTVFAENTYILLEPFMPQAPERFQKMFPYMKQQNWLNNYRYKWGIAQSLAGVVRRSAYLTESDTAFALFEENDRISFAMSLFFIFMKQYLLPGKVNCFFSNTFLFFTLNSYPK